MLTARGDRDSVVSVLSSGAQDYVIKPFRSYDLIVKVKRQLKHHSDVTVIKRYADNSICENMLETNQQDLLIK